HEGGELGYVLAHAFGAAFDNPDLVVAAVVGDGEAETGPLEGSWKSTSFLNPARDGAVLPILHLNGYKISGPTVLAREAPDDARRDRAARGLVEEHELLEPCARWRGAADSSFERLQDQRTHRARARSARLRAPAARELRLRRARGCWKRSVR